jgi:hypothetical protein
VEFAAEVRKRWMARAERCGNLEGYARLLELASKLGHSAREVLADGHHADGHQPVGRLEVTGAGGGPIRVELEAALKKVYGEVVDVEATKMVTAEIVESAEGEKTEVAGGGVSTN